MSTRSNIIMQDADGTCRTIYCHNDGHPDGVGRMLAEHYADPEDIRRLIDLGDISWLGETPEDPGDLWERQKTILDTKPGETPGEWLDRVDRETEKLAHYTLSYATRGDTGVKAEEHATLAQALGHLCPMAAYVYAWTPDTGWTGARNGEPLEPLDRLIARHPED